MFFYMLIILVVKDINFTTPLPILSFKLKTNEILIPSNKLETRFTRQVVQPKWLNFDREHIVDPKVHVNRQSLREAEEIRKIIQKAVDEDTFVVTDTQQNKNKTAVKFAPTVEMNRPHIINDLRSWYVQIQKLWSNWMENLSKGLRMHHESNKKN